MPKNVFDYEQFYDKVGKAKGPGAQGGELVDLAQERLDRTPHRLGHVACICCGHEYDAVAPVGVHALECTQCGQFMAFYTHPVEPGVGDLVWRCDFCNGQAFSKIIRNGTRYFWCCGCGVYITPEDFLTD